MNSFTHPAAGEGSIWHSSASSFLHQFLGIQDSAEESRDSLVSHAPTRCYQVLGVAPTRCGAHLVRPGVPLKSSTSTTHEERRRRRRRRSASPCASETEGDGEKGGMGTLRYVPHGATPPCKSHPKQSPIGLSRDPSTSEGTWTLKEHYKHYI